MIRSIKLCLFILLISSVAAMCEETKKDSIATIKQANIDAQSFKLNNTAWKKYKHNLPQSSDYFKPGPSDVKDAAMLSDSLYVTSYRDAAFRKNKGRHAAILFGADFATVLVTAAVVSAAIFIRL